MCRLVLLILLLLVLALSASAQAVALVADSTQSGFGGSGDMVVDDSGIYLSGRTAVFPSLRTHTADGQLQWQRTFVVPTTNAPASVAGGIAVTSDAIYIAAAGPSSRPRENDIFLRRYTHDGTAIWVRQIDIPTNDFPGGVAADQGSVYVAGRTGTHEGVVRKYDNDGNELWTRAIVFNLPNVSRVSLVLNASGLYVAGAGQLINYDPSGNELWNKEVAADGQVAGITLFDDMVYIVGTQNGFSVSSTRSFLLAYSTSGEFGWSRQFGPDSATAVVVDTSGIYVGGGTSYAVKGNCRYGATDSVVRRFNTDGSESWARQYGFDNFDSVRAIGVNSSGLYAVGRVLSRIGKTPEIFDPSRPRINYGCIVNAASHVGGGVAPGEMVTFMGSGLGPSTAVSQRLTDQGLLATQLGGTSVLFDDIPAPLIQVSEKQSTAIVPYELAGRTIVSVEIDYEGRRSDLTRLGVFAALPGIFTSDGSGSGQALAFNEDGTPNSPSNPASKGSMVTFYVTGEGAIDMPLPTGAIVGAAAVRPKVTPKVYVDSGCESIEAPLVDAVEKSGGPTGVLEIRVRIPQYANYGDQVALGVNVGTSQAPFGASLAIRDDRNATELQISPASGIVNNLFTTTIIGETLSSDTYLDITYRTPDSDLEWTSLNWQYGKTAAHVIAPGTTLGTWIITGIRVHSNASDHTGTFTPANVRFTVEGPRQ